MLVSKSSLLKITAAAAVISGAGTAHAEIFNYDTSIGGNNVLLSIDTALGTATYSGSGTNVVYSGADLSGFNGSNPRGALRFTSVTGQINDGGTVVTPLINPGRTATVRFRSGGRTSLWTRAQNPDGSRAAFDIPSTFTPRPTGSSTSSGGLSSTGGVSTSSSSSSSSSSGGSTGGSSGGTSVPAPGILGLLGLGLAGLAFGSRRKNRK